MSKHKSQKRDNTFKIAAITFAIIILAVGTALVINSHTLSFIGTVDGQRLPMAQFHFQENTMWEQLGDMAMFIDQRTFAEMTFESLADMHIIANRGAGDFEVVMTSEDIAESRAWADTVRRELMFMDHGGERDLIAEMGFSRSAFYSFMEMMALVNLIYDEVVESVDISEDELSDLFDAYIDEYRDEYRVPIVYAIEFMNMFEAEAAREQLLFGTDPRQLIFEGIHNVAEYMEEIEPRHILNYTHFLTQEMWDTTRETPIGRITEPMESTFGHYVIFVVEGEEYQLPELENWSAMHLAERGHELFGNYLDMWRNQAAITQNNRVFNRFGDAGGFDFGDILEIDLE